MSVTLKTLALAFKDRAAGQGWKPKSAAYQKAALEFFMGAKVALQDGPDALSDWVLLMIAIGHDPVKEWGQ